jgi:hypothetical protein
VVSAAARQQNIRNRFAGLPVADLKRALLAIGETLDLVLRADDDLLDAERELVETLTAEWEGRFPDARAIALRIVKGKDLDELFTEADAQEIVDAIRPVLDEGWLDAVDPAVRAAIETTYALGREKVAKALAIDVDWDLVDDKAQQALVDDSMYWIGDAYDNQLGGQVADLIREMVIEQGLSRREAGAALEELFGEAFPARSRNYWNIVAAAGTVRSRTFGTLGGFAQADVETFRFRAVDDARTSDICLHLDGMVFRLDAALGQRDAWMGARTPDAAKVAHPWPKPEVVLAMNAEELQAAGIFMPPLHGH